MYARIARFDGGDRNWDEFATNIGETLQNPASDSPFEGIADATTRVMLFVDRANNRGANLFLCDTEEDLRRVDAALNATAPAGGRGARTSVEMYEVLLDQDLRR